MKIERVDGVGDLSVTYTMTYADAATHKQVADLACAVFCGLMAEDLKRRGERGTADIEKRAEQLVIQREETNENVQGV